MKKLLLALVLLSSNSFAEWTAYIQPTIETISVRDGTEESIKNKTITYFSFVDKKEHTVKLIEYDQKESMAYVRDKKGNLFAIKFADEEE